MMNDNSVEHLFERLAAAGFTRPYLNKYIFPSWWSNNLAVDQAGYAQAIGFIHNHIGIPVENLWDSKSPIKCPKDDGVFYKKGQNVPSEAIESARCIAVAMADLALSIMPRNQAKQLKKPKEIRQEILASGHKFVDLGNLLDYLWGYEIPVIHIEKFPQKKMAGLVVKRNERIAIILSKNHTYQSLVAFDLAHEFGHLLSGHLADNDAVVDIDIIQKGETDPKEIEATQAGIEVLAGHRDIKFGYTDGDPVAWAERKSKETSISPGIVAQMAGHELGDYSFGNKVCYRIERGIKPIELIQLKMIKNLRLDDLSPDDFEFLMRAAGGGKKHALAAGYQPHY